MLAIAWGKQIGFFKNKGGMTIKKTLLTLVVLLSFDSTLACDSNGHSGLLPKGNLFLSLNYSETGNFTKERFHQIVDDVVSLYQDKAKRLGTKIVSIQDWDKEEVNAYATQDDGNFTIKLYGGLARSEVLTEDGFALVVCHELGHHFGGGIKKIMTHPQHGTITLWSVSEGEADYWASLKCIKKYFRQFGDNSKVNESIKSEVIINKCNESSTNTTDRKICLRTSLAGESMANLLLSMRNMAGPVSFSTPSTVEVYRTLHEHTHPQCRLDTFTAGANCNISENLEVDMTNPNVNTCTSYEQDSLGSRPRCWYQPSDYQQDRSDELAYIE